MTTPRPRISVVVPTYNRYALLRRTLESLARQDLPAGAVEVVVADDGSTDDTQQLCESFADQLMLRYHFQENLGYRAGAARNAGARLASAPIVAFLDTGTLASAGYARGHLHEHSDGTSRAVIGYTYGYVTQFEPDRHRSLVNLLARTGDEQADLEGMRGAAGFEDMRHDDFVEVGFDLDRMAASWCLFWTVNVSVRAADFRAVGGFDEEFVGWGGEDMDLGRRLQCHGVRLRLSQDAWAIELPHERDSATNELSNRRNLAKLLAKNRHPEVEVALVSRVHVRPLQASLGAYLAWAARAHDLDVSAELADLDRRVPALRRTGHRIAVFGSGSAVPASWPACTLLDFDRARLDTAVAGTVHTGLHAVGLRTLLPDGGFDAVVVTSRLAGLWPAWGEQILDEARRIGGEVHVTFAGGSTGPDGDRTATQPAGSAR